MNTDRADSRAGGIAGCGHCIYLCGFMGAYQYACAA